MNALNRFFHRASVVRCVASAAVFLTGELPAEYDREAILYAIDAKQFQLVHERADLAEVLKKQAMLEAHPTNASAAAGKFDTALASLGSYHTQLSDVHDANKWKTALKMMIKTGKGIHDSVNFAKQGTADLVNHGVTTAVGNFAWDQMQGAVEGDLKKKIGIDIDSLSAYQTRKVAACTQLASTKLKELHGVRQAISLTLDDVKAVIEAESGTEITSNDVAVLRRNVILRQQIEKAQSAIGEMQTSASEASEDLSDKQADLQVSIDAINERINRLHDEIAALRVELNEGELAALLATATEAIDEPEELPGPDVSVPEDPSSDYESRLEAARRAAVIAMWNAQSPSLINAIETHKSAINHLWNNLQGRYTDNVVPHDPAGFIKNKLGAAPPPPAIYSDVAGLAGSLTSSQNTLEGVQTAMEEVPDLLFFCEDLQEEFIDLGNTTNELVSLVNLVQSVPAAWSGLSYGTAYESPATCTLDEVNALATYLAELKDLFPLAEKNETETQSAMSEGYGIVHTAAASFTTEIRSELAAAEAAMNEMVNVARAYQRVLSSIPELAPHKVPGLPTSFYGHWTKSPVNDSTDGYVRVLDRVYYRRLYTLELAKKIRDGGYTAAAAYKARIERTAQTAEKLRDRYSAAWQRFSTAYEQLELAANPHGIALFHNMSSISTPPAGTGSLPQVSGDNARFLNLRGGYTIGVTTALDGGSRTPGEDYATNYGLQKLNELPEILIDKEDRPLVIHSILEQMQAVAEHSQSDWLALSNVDFQNIYWSRSNELGDIARNLSSTLGSDLGGFFVQQEDYDLINETIASVGADFSQAYNLYIEKEKPAIKTYTEAANVSARSGESAEVVLSVQATGDDLEYQWYRSIYTFPGPGYTNYNPMPGEQSPTLSTTVDNRRDFYCQVKNTAGQVLTPPIPVEFREIANPLSWVGVDTRNAQVAMPFEWALQSSPMASNWEVRGLPAGLSVNTSTGVLNGIPTGAGTLKLFVEGTLGDRFVSKSISLEIAPPPPLAEVMGDWLGEFFTPAQLDDPEMAGPDASPAGDGVANRLKFALGLDPATPVRPEDMLTLTVPPIGQAQIQFQVSKPANALGLRAHLYQAVSLLGPWWPVSDVVEDEQGDWIGISAPVSKSHDLYYKIVLEEPE